MKKILLILLLAPVFGLSQVFVPVSTGYDFSVHEPMVTIGCGARFDRFEIAGEVRVVPNADSAGINYAGLKAGWKFFNRATLSVGRYLNSSTMKFVMFYSAQAEGKFTEITKWFVEAAYIDKHKQLNAGFKIILE